MAIVSINKKTFENKVGKTHPIEPDALAALFEQFSDQVNCVVLNACYSETQANAIANHIDYVIGMNEAINDKAAIAFSIGFYQALGAGRTIEEAYKLGCVQIRLQGIPKHLVPVLIKKEETQAQRFTQGTGFLSRFEATDNRTKGSQAPRLDDVDGLAVLDFDADRDQIAEFSGTLLPSYRGSGIDVKIHFSMSSAVVGTVRWAVSMRRNLADDRSRDFTSSKFVSQSVPKNHLENTVGVFSFQDGEEMDQIGAGDPFILRVTREATHPDDTAPGDAELITIEVFESAR